LKKIPWLYQFPGIDALEKYRFSVGLLLPFSILVLVPIWLIKVVDP
jgi:hypothetical protein